MTCEQAALYAPSVNVTVPTGRPVAVMLAACEGVTSKERITVAPGPTAVRTIHLTSAGAFEVVSITSADSTLSFEFAVGPHCKKPGRERAITESPGNMNDATSEPPVSVLRLVDDAP